MVFASSSVRHRLFGTAGYNIPKPKFLYYVNFVSNKLPAELIRDLNFFVKRIDRIQLTYDVEEMNQYNKKRLIQSKINYGPLNISFHDTTDSTALRMIEAYNRFYYHDFDLKNNSSWLYDITSGPFEPTGEWGLKANQTPNNQYFFDRVEIFEIFDQTFTKINFINPKITTVDFQQMDQELSIGSEVMINMAYEGIVVENISERVTPDLAARFGLPFVQDLGLNIFGPFRSGPASLFDNIIGNVANSFGGGVGVGQQNDIIGGLTGALVTSFNGGFNTNQGQIFGTQPNSILSGRLSFDPFSTTQNLIPNVRVRANSGNIVRDISTGVVNQIDNVIDSFLRF